MLLPLVFPESLFLRYRIVPSPPSLPPPSEVGDCAHLGLMALQTDTLEDLNLPLLLCFVCSLFL